MVPLQLIELTSLQREIDGLIALEYQMDRNLEEMKKLVSASRYNETLGGRILRIAGTVFAVYCVFRSISVRSFPGMLLDAFLIQFIS